MNEHRYIVGKNDQSGNKSTNSSQLYEDLLLSSDSENNVSIKNVQLSLYTYVSTYLKSINNICTYRKYNVYKEEIYL